MDKEELRRRIVTLLREQSILTLAVADDCGVPWAAPLFYAADGFDIFFVSDPGSRHGRAIARSPAVAAAVHAPDPDWRQIRGLQIEGEASKIADGDLADRALRRYVERFPFTDIFFRRAEVLGPEIAERVSAARFHLLRPARIVLVDNSVAFGFHAELAVEK